MHIWGTDMKKYMKEKYEKYMKENIKNIRKFSK